MKDSLHIQISIQSQALRLLRGSKVIRTFPISSSAGGIGFEPDSLRTPTGSFVVAEKIGAGAPLGTVFTARQPSGIWHPGGMLDHDLVLTRILVLDGLDPANRNTRQRCIYLHGTNREDLIGHPASNGCLRLANRDMIELFDLVPAGTPLSIDPPKRSDLKLLFLECDGSLSSIEGIAELATAAGEEIHRRVAELTEAAVSGQVPVGEVFARQMQIIRPNAETCRKVADLYLASCEPGVGKAIAQARELGWTPVILSGAFAPLLAPLAAKLGISQVEAVPLTHADDGSYLGYDTYFPTARTTGKRECVRRWIAATNPLLTVMVGSGLSDLETSGVVDCFIAYTGVPARPSVVAGADHVIEHWKNLPRILGKLHSKHLPKPGSMIPAATPITRERNILLAELPDSGIDQGAMSAKKKGIRYTAQEKAEVTGFVNEYNTKNGRGGQAAAAAKFGVTPLTVSAWLKNAGKPPKAPKAPKPAKEVKPVEAAPAKRRGRPPGSSKAATAAKAATASKADTSSFSSKLRRLADINDEIASTEAKLAKLRAEFAAAKASI